MQVAFNVCLRECVFDRSAGGVCSIIYRRIVPDRRKRCCISRPSWPSWPWCGSAAACCVPQRRLLGLSATRSSEDVVQLFVDLRRSSESLLLAATRRRFPCPTPHASLPCCRLLTSLFRCLLAIRLLLSPVGFNPRRRIWTRRDTLLCRLRHDLVSAPPQ